MCLQNSEVCVVEEGRPSMLLQPAAPGARLQAFWYEKEKQVVVVQNGTYRVCFEELGWGGRTLPQHGPFVRKWFSPFDMGLENHPCIYVMYPELFEEDRTEVHGEYPAKEHEGMYVAVKLVLGQHAEYVDEEELVFREVLGDEEVVIYHAVLQLCCSRSSEVICERVLCHAVAEDGDQEEGWVAGLEQRAMWYSDGSGVHGAFPTLLYAVKFF